MALLDVYHGRQTWADFIGSQSSGAVTLQSGRPQEEKLLPVYVPIQTGQ